MADLRKRMEELKGEWATCKSQEDQKNSVVQSLFEAVQKLQVELKDAELELADKKDAMRVARGRIEDMEHEKERLAFILVLIDGDCMPFRDELVKQGAEGGRRTASLLKQAVEEDIGLSKQTLPAHVQVMARVYANTKGLEKVYKDTNILPRSECFREFIRGFNMGDPMCDYVDAGNGKECSDEKVKAAFKWNLSIVHCQRIYFGGSTDNGYARLLGPYLETQDVCRRVRLVEGPPFAHELADIKDRFGTATFGDVFRTQKLPTLKRRVSWQTTPPGTPSIDYATVASRPVTTPSPTGPPGLPAPQASATTGKVLHNRLGQRVDSDLKFSPADFQDLKARKLCNRFHLTGKCPNPQIYGKCYHEHGERVPAAQRQALLAISRLSPCSTGTWCDDPKCISGHRCPRPNCYAEDCRFPYDMHDVDTHVVS